MPYSIRKKGQNIVVYRLPYPGESQKERQVAVMDTGDMEQKKRNANLYVAFASKKDKKKGG